MKISREEWRQIYIRLYAYTDSLLKSSSWFRTGASDTYLKGKEAKDYVMEAIAIYLSNLDKYDCSQRSLIGYLKKHIVRSLIGNDVRSAENKSINGKISSILSNPANTRGIETVSPVTDALFGEEIDYKLIMTKIKTEVNNDEDAAQLFQWVSFDGLVRRQVIAEHGWTTDRYDNTMKRLKRILTSVASMYHLTSKK